MNKLMLVLQLVKKTIGNFSWPEFVGKKRPGNQNLYKKLIQYCQDLEWNKGSHDTRITGVN